MEKILTLGEMKAIYQAKSRLGEADAILEEARAAGLDLTDSAIVDLANERGRLQKQIQDTAPSVEKTLAAIPDHFSRLVCSLRYRQAYTYDAIGKLLKQSGSTVRRRSDRALLKLEEGKNHGHSDT